MPEPKPYPPKSRLDQLLSYDPSTGEMRWRVRVSASRRAGDVAGGVSTQGYMVVRVDGRLLLGHRVAWVMMTGEQPPALLDHRNEVGTDNRWDNLRASNKPGNNQNRSAAMSRNTSTGCRNVTYRDGRRRPYLVQVQMPSGPFRATFDTLLDAAACAIMQRRAAIEQHHLA